MNRYIAHYLLVKDGLAHNHPQLPWLRRKLYRSSRDANKNLKKSKKIFCLKALFSE
ncbi:hypothetical protein IWQ55_003907 [Labrenzia sp. EL_208]|uniref:Uncharacterized protein n=1 Tax=Roseibium album TaxID=311410 RepID=A0A0M6ZK36_9HYPH|nr:hypothetical protein [Labrenzia sp. EL_132]MBG6230684.1 hypothetical protein [Labrenzia sp. EL_208]CTQ61844.1 hypothetical protein LA5094_04626 [Roseibium album]CTQ75183.1 hypothetical protein LA5096_04262 [Roseibium album]CTQ78660.1 hypothetical protein LA5095_04441 [Roseibium album]